MYIHAFICKLGIRVTHCNTLQHTATHCNTLQHTYFRKHVCVWCVYIRASIVIVCCSMLHCVAFMHITANMNVYVTSTFGRAVYGTSTADAQLSRRNE